jgi:hypothetical protein
MACGNDLERLIAVLMLGITQSSIEIRFNPFWLINRQPRYSFTILALGLSASSTANNLQELLKEFGCIYLNLALKLMACGLKDSCSEG